MANFSDDYGLSALERFERGWRFITQRELRPDNRFRRWSPRRPPTRARDNSHGHAQQRELARGKSFHIATCKILIVILSPSHSSIMQRTHHCGELRPENIGQTVTLCGWSSTVRDQSYQCFIDLRDRSGLVQIVADREINAANLRCLWRKSNPSFVCKSLAKSWRASRAKRIRNLPTGQDRSAR